MFYEKVTLLCLGKGVTVSRMCEECGLSTSAAVRWKRGATPNSATVQTIARYFRIDPDYLVDNRYADYESWVLSFETPTNGETALPEDGLDEEFVLLAKKLSAPQMQRVKDFMRGILS